MRSTACKPHCRAMSVAFDAPGEIVPSLGTTNTISPAPSSCPSKPATGAGPYVSRACSVAVSASDKRRASLTKCQYCVSIPLRRGRCCVACWKSLLRRNSDRARRPGSLRISDMRACQEPQSRIIPAAWGAARPRSFELHSSGIMSQLATAPALPLYRTDEIRRIESLAHSAAGLPRLMESAGLAAAELARDLNADGGKSVLVLAGPGNNGGDALVAARHLKQWWHRVSLVFTGQRSKLSADAAAAFDAWTASGGEVLSDPPRGALRTFGLIVDGLFGVGLERDISAGYAELIAAVNASAVPVLALDVPSGLHADSGRVLGSAVQARHTITFIALKPGLLTLDGPDLCGELHVEGLGLNVEALLAPKGRTIASAVERAVLPPRRLNSHKGTFGSVGVVGGAEGMTGAALLAARAALELGSGRVYAGFLGPDAPRLDFAQPELMLRSAQDVLAMEALECLVLGPGLSQSHAAMHCVEQALARDVALVIDADALNLIGAHSGLQDSCRARRAATVITPHPAEAGRLAGVSTGEIQNDRV